MAENLACDRGGRRVFNNINFTLNAGEMMELRGINGSGKSSLLRLIAGLNAPSFGRVFLGNGTDDLTLGQHAMYVGHTDANKSLLTVRQNLDFWSKFMGGNASDEALDTFNLSALSDYPVLLLSAGQKRRLALARLVLARRPLWLLDEPTVGLDQQSFQKLQVSIISYLGTGGMIIAATHSELGVAPVQRLQLGMAE